MRDRLRYLRNYVRANGYERVTRKKERDRSIDIRQIPRGEKERAEQAEKFVK